MTFPGAGGQVPPRIDQQVQQAQAVPVSPGGSPIARVTEIIITPGGVLEGIFTYSSNPPAAGTLIESASVATAGTDKFGNHFVAGHASYTSSTATALAAGEIDFYTGSLAGGWTLAATQQFSAGFILMSTGLETQNNLLDDGTGNCSVLGTMTIQGTSCSIGNGSTADLFLSPKIATPPNLAAVVNQTANLAQTQACLGAFIQSWQNRGAVNLGLPPRVPPYYHGGMGKGPHPRDTTVPVTIYLPRPLYEWMVLRKARGHGPLTQQVAGYCQEGRIRDELTEAADAINPDPGALERLQARIERSR